MFSLGTTLTQEMTYLIMTLDFETAKNVDLDDRFPFADTMNVNYPYYRGLKYLAELPTDKPRMIKSHFHYTFLPDDIQKRKKGKVHCKTGLYIIQRFFRKQISRTKK